MEIKTDKLIEVLPWDGGFVANYNDSVMIFTQDKAIQVHKDSLTDLIFTLANIEQEESLRVLYADDPRLDKSPWGKEDE
jgi:hypothetical protein